LGKVYNCLRCSKWFGRAKKERIKDSEVEVCPSCGMRVYRARGPKAVFVPLWWGVKKTVTIFWEKMWKGWGRW